MLRPNFCALVVFLLALGSYPSVHALWQVVSPNLATALLGVAAIDENTAYVVGDQNELGPVLLQTTNKGQNWTNLISGGAVFVFDISLFDTKNGYAAGLGLASLQGAYYTTDGTTWTDSPTKRLEGAFQNVGHVSQSEVWQVGTWAELGNLKGNGVQWSFDGGITFVGANWDQNTTARYGSFLDSKTGWISGGEFPTSNSDDLASTTFHFNQHLSILDGAPTLVRKSKKPPKVEGKYRAGISMTTDGGYSWTELYNNTGTKTYGFYFNGISFTDKLNGWVVGEGQQKDANTSYSFIWGTKDGGQTWQTQLEIEDASITQIKMVDAQNGWACGGVDLESGVMRGAFWRTSNGQNWTIDSTILGSYQLNLGVKDFDTAWSVGIDILGASSVSRYLPL